jgi:type IV secretory pathway VirB2 component (pilin)
MKKILFLSFIVVCVALFSYSKVFASTEDGCNAIGGDWNREESVCKPNPTKQACIGGGGKWEKQDGDTSARCHTNTDKGPNVPGTIKNIIDLLLYLAGMIAVIMIIIAGIRYVTSNGDPQTASKAKNTIIYAVIGLVITILAYAIVNFVLSQLG